jgi:hypothetical protein
MDTNTGNRHEVKEETVEIDAAADINKDDENTTPIVEEQPINVVIKTEEGNLVVSISQSGKKFEKCEGVENSNISLQYDSSGGITSITFNPPSICVKTIPDPTADNGDSGGYRKVKRSTRKNKKRRSKRKY